MALDEKKSGRRTKYRPFKQNHRMGRNRLKGKNDDQMNAIMSAARLNFRKLLRWLADFYILFIFLFRLMRVEAGWRIEIMATGK